MLRPIVAMQHTSIDVFAYAERRNKMPAKQMSRSQWGKRTGQWKTALFCGTHCAVFYRVSIAASG
jgi:hypothetical protein